MPRSTQSIMWELAGERLGSYQGRLDESMKITIALATPVASVDGFINFDAVLHYAQLQALRESAGERFRGYPKTLVKNMPLPLRHLHTDTGRLFFAASIGIYEAPQEVQRWKKRWDDEYDDFVDFGKRKLQVDIKSAGMRSYNMPMILRSAPEIVFYARGWTEEVRRLMKWVTHVGKKHSQGYGRASNIRVEPTEEDRSIMWSGHPARPIPAEWWTGDKGRMALWGYRPPYYLPQHQTLCVLPC